MKKHVNNERKEPQLVDKQYKWITGKWIYMFRKIKIIIIKTKNIKMYENDFKSKFKLNTWTKTLKIIKSIHGKKDDWIKN